MKQTAPFEDLLLHVRAGDQEAAAELVRIYEPSIRRVARLRMANSPLSALLDSTDICQSVLASFFVRMNLGQHSLSTPEQLIGLLATMARSKLAAEVRREQAQRRDRRRTVRSPDGLELPGVSPTPSRELAAKELLAQVRQGLTNDERMIVDLRQEGEDWVSVAKQIGSSPDAARMRLTRAIDRVSNELGIELS